MDELNPPSAEQLLSPSQGSIDPLPHLGVLLNHLEGIILSQGAILRQLCKLVAANNLVTAELDAAMTSAYRAEASYGALKDALIAEAKDPGDG